MPRAKFLKLKRPVHFDSAMKALIEIGLPPTGKKSQDKRGRKKRRSKK